MKLSGEVRENFKYFAEQVTKKKVHFVHTLQMHGLRLPWKKK